MIVSVHTRFSEKFDSWICTWDDVVYLLILLQCSSISRIWSSDSLSTGCLCLILRKRITWCFWSLLQVYAWFREAEHVMWFKLVECLCLIWGSGARNVLEFGVLEELCIFKRASMFEGSWSLKRKLVSSNELQSSRLVDFRLFGEFSLDLQE